MERAEFFLLLVLWVLGNFAPEKFWPVSILVLLPQHLLALPALALGVLAWRSRQSRLIGLQIPAALFFLFGFMGFNIPLHTAPPRGKTLRAMTFNIRSGSLGIGKIAALVAAENPEILCVQEGAARFGFPDPIPVLKKSLPQYHVARFSELAIFSKFPITKIVRHALPDFKTSTGILEVRLDVKGKIVTVFCAHFSNPIDNKILAWPHEIGTRAPIREAQFRLLETATGRTSTPYFTAGDFNTPPRGSLYRKLSNRFEDGFTASSFGLGNSFPAFFPVARLDYFWTKEPTRVVACRVLTPRASDHRALVAEIATS